MTPKETIDIIAIISFIIATLITKRFAKQSYDPAPYYIFMLIPLFAFIMMIPILTTALMSERYCEYSTVTSIGGCDKYGDCSAMTQSGKKAYSFEPVMGEKIPIECDLRWR